MNNIERVQNLQRCESLHRLDLTLNFVGAAGLLSLRGALQPCAALRELTHTGNPCTRWPGYRAYVVGTLPQLVRLDDEEVRWGGCQRRAELGARLGSALLDGQLRTAGRRCRCGHRNASPQHSSWSAWRRF